MELVETLVIRLCESLTGSLTLEKIACLEPTKNTKDKKVIT